MNLQEKSRRINEMVLDLTAEYLAVCLFQEGISKRDILAIYEGDLKRKWSADVDRAEVETFEGGKHALTICLNRTGIYDSLPEALFHRFNDNRNATGEDMAKDSMLLKTEEKQVRKFFRPFENEIFLQRTEVANNENEVFKNLYSDFLHQLIPGFWNVDERIPDYYVSKLIRFLPFANRVAGNLELTAQCLEKIISEKVTIDLKNEEKNVLESEISPPDFEGGKLGKSKLGSDLIMGQNPAGFVGRLLIKIGPLQNTNPKDFFSNGPAGLLLKCFFGYFVPAELDIEFKLIPENEKRKFFIDDSQETAQSFLGYNTAL
jgi:hypothetical protein